MKRLFILIGLVLGLVGPVHAELTVVAGPIDRALTGLDSEHDALFCNATNLSSMERPLKYATVKQDGTLTAAPGHTVVGPLVTNSNGDFAVLCIWAIEGNPEAWRFTACVGSSVTLGCTGGFVEGRVAPGIKFPEAP